MLKCLSTLCIRRFITSGLSECCWNVTWKVDVSNNARGQKPRPWIVCGIWWTLATMSVPCFVAVRCEIFLVRNQFFPPDRGFRIRRIIGESSIRKNFFWNYAIFPAGAAEAAAADSIFRGPEAQNPPRWHEYWSYLVVFCHFMMLKTWAADVSGVHGCKASKIGAWRIWSVSRVEERNVHRTGREMTRSDTDEVFEKGDWSACSTQKRLASDSFPLLTLLA